MGRSWRKSSFTWFVHKTKDFETAVSEHIGSSLTDSFTVCQSLVYLNYKVPLLECWLEFVYVSAHAIEISQRFFLCSLSSVNVVDSLTLDLSQYQKKGSLPTTGEIGCAF